MTTTSKIALSAIVAGVFSLGQVAQAGLINGSVSFSGNVQAFQNTLGTGPVATTYTSAGSLVFGGSPIVVNSGPSGSFAGTAGAPVTMTPLIPLLPVALVPGLDIAVPSGTLLWSFVSGGHTFTFTLNAPLSETLVTANTLILSGTGSMSDNVPGDITNPNGTWVASFTSATSGPNVTFAYSSSSAANINAPEAGTSLLLLGLGLAAIGTYAQFRKQVA